MKISNVYIGGWFQRTMLQLSEIYDFLRGSEVRVKLNPKKLDTFRANLNIKSIEYGLGHEEYVEFATGGGYLLKSLKMA